MTTALAPRRRMARAPRLHRGAGARPAEGAGEGQDLVVEMAHDLRSPLSAILVLSDAIRSGQAGEVSDRQRDLLGMIYYATLRLSEAANDVLDLSREGTGLLDEPPAPFSLTEVLQGVRDVVRPIAEAKGLDLVVSLQAEDVRYGHARALSRVLLNLATNALKYTERGFVRIAARGPTGVPGRLEVSVTDSGPGLCPDVARTLSRPLQEHTPGRMPSISSGLGLVICRRLLAGMGSELRCESRPGVGTQFSFVLELPTVASAA